MGRERRGGGGEGKLMVPKCGRGGVHWVNGVLAQCDQGTRVDHLKACVEVSEEGRRLRKVVALACVSNYSTMRANDERKNKCTINS